MNKPLYTKDEIDNRRRAVMQECGLDPYAQPPEVWLNIAVAAAARGEAQYAKDCELAMNIANDRQNWLLGIKK